MSDSKVTLLNSAVGPVTVVTEKKSTFDIDDYVSLTVQSKGDFLRLLNKARSIKDLEAKGRPIVRIGDVVKGGYDAI